MAAARLLLRRFIRRYSSSSSFPSPLQASVSTADVNQHSNLNHNNSQYPTNNQFHHPVTDASYPNSQLQNASQYNQESRPPPDYGSRPQFQPGAHYNQESDARPNYNQNPHFQPASQYSEESKHLPDYNQGFQPSANYSQGFQPSANYSQGFQPSANYSQGFHPSADYSQGFQHSSSYNQGFQHSSSYNQGFQHSANYNQGFQPSANYNQGLQATSNYNYNPHAQPPASDFQQNTHFPSNFQSSFSTPDSNVNSASSSSSSSSSSSPGPMRSYGFSSAEEAAAERRRRKRRLRIEPPLYALRPNPSYNQSDANNPDKPRLPDSTSALVGNRLNLHNRVQSLIRAGDLDAASYVVRQSVFQAVRPTVFTCNAIIASMYRAKRYNDAKALFQYFFRQFNIIPNIVSYNNLIVSHCESNEVDDALKVYEYILEHAPYSPSSVTYRHLTKGLIDAARIDDAVNLLREMLHKGHGADSLVYNNVILGFLNLGNLEKANELFDELKERCTVYDGVVNATFMNWFFNQGKPKEAMESYRDLMGRNYRMVPATRNVLLETLLKHGKTKEAWELFNDMLDDHTPPTFQAVNSDTVNMMVNECFKEGKVEEAIEVFKRSGKGVKSKPFQMDVAGFNNMITRLCELEMMDEAEQYYKQLCDKSLSPDVNTYRIMIDSYIKVNMVDNVLLKYLKLVELGLRVIPPYANKWFGFLIEKGKASDCLPILSKMADREPKPDVTTYDIVIRGLVDEGNYDAAANVLREMMNHGVGTSHLLKDFVLNVFEKQGRRMEIETILNSLSSQRPFLGTRGSPRTARPPEISEQGRNAALPWLTSSSPQATTHTSNDQTTYKPQMSEDMTHSQTMSGQDVELPRMASQYGG